MQKRGLRTLRKRQLGLLLAEVQGSCGRVLDLRTAAPQRGKAGKVWASLLLMKSYHAQRSF